MAKSKVSYICTSCDTVYAAWQGKCTNCGEWNTIVHDNFDDAKLKLAKPIDVEANVKQLSSVSSNDKKIVTKVQNFNAILSGGILPGQVILFAGEPGIGKSTLLTQICVGIDIPTLYISGEESLDQIAKRAKRFADFKQFENAKFSDNTRLEDILTLIKSKDFELIIIDSIQTIHSDEVSGFPGSMNQIRECANYLIDYAKKNGVALIVIGQITKEGSIAGPKILEHMVDTVLYFEGDSKNDTRILKVTKNRFGSTQEIAIFEMAEKGLKEVNDLEWFFTDELKSEEGVAYSIYNEGSAYFVIEVQALVAKSSFAYPKRVSNGIDSKRLEMLIAILSKKLGMKLENFDIYLNIIGGIKISDTSGDLAACAAIISSYKNKPLPAKTCFLGEVSLTGEIRRPSKHETKLAKAKKFGFKSIVSSENMENLTRMQKL
jgi:DNA repair protein RadA/Sms